MRVDVYLPGGAGWETHLTFLRGRFQGDVVNVALNGVQVRVPLDKGDRPTVRKLSEVAAGVPATAGQFTMSWDMGAGFTIGALVVGPDGFKQLYPSL